MNMDANLAGVCLNTRNNTSQIGRPMMKNSATVATASDADDIATTERTTNEISWSMNPRRATVLARLSVVDGDSLIPVSSVLLSNQ